MSEPRQVVDRLAEALVTNDPQTAADIYAEDCVIVDPKFDVVGRDGALEAFTYYFDAFQVERVDVKETIEQGDSIAVHWEWEGVHKGEYMGIAPTGKRVKTWNVVFFRVADGHVKRDLSTWDVSQYLDLTGEGEA